MDNLITKVSANETYNLMPTVRRTQLASPPMRVFSHQRLGQIPQLVKHAPQLMEAISLVARVLPFKVNDYVIKHLIDWHDVPNDPIFRLTFPQAQMLDAEDLERLAHCVRSGAGEQALDTLVQRLRDGMNPHPAQQQLNAPLLDGERLHGVQHKYPQTVLFFPSHGQTCHSYCTFCFRWPQFIGDKSLKFASNDGEQLHRYLARHPEVTDVLFTGGDPLVMTAAHLKRYLEPFLDPALRHVTTIRIGTKALTYWPYRFVSDVDTPQLMAVLRRLVDSGKHVALMAHLNHWRELSTPIAQEAVAALQQLGIVIRAQGPVLKHINDSAATWKRNWEEQVRLGIVPYYMFVERDTGPRDYFQIPLARALSIYSEAIESVSGLAKTARGPSMSAGPGKVEVSGTLELHGQRHFLLKFIQARDSRWLGRPFLARYSETACWLDQLQPPEGQAEFFFEADYRRFMAQASTGGEA
ncbi:KamA family radical SAM protein [Pseudomonas xantholysinigenes]|uniref:Lysine 2,3-aminomutase n=1 Tax=Pseudomonas xantholysinigenes TaxID=2745490 RepID=A0A9E6TUN2_9PSED|nr:lysine 2,3-aminomutase [Pseudomonas xantholysinigenes]QXI36428.1 lysine 2,3-aminomutase [Pseudomonas xantholysinigenes]